MSNKIDSVFKSKLENYQVKPPVDAWASIESGISKENAHKFPVIKIAASLILISVSTLIAYNYLNNSEKDVISNNTIVKENPLTDVQSDEQTILPESESKEQIEAIASANSAKDNETRLFIKDLKTIQPLAYEHKVTSISKIVLNRVVVANTPIEIPPYEAESLPAVTISYRPGDKILDDNATSEPEKESTLRKAWDYALSVKNGEERPFNIKEMKNELFASNFKKKRSKTQD